jgi:hypothetical protein
MHGAYNVKLSLYIPERRILGVDMQLH